MDDWRTWFLGRNLSRGSERTTMKKSHKKRASKAPVPGKPHPPHELSEEQLEGVAGGTNPTAPKGAGPSAGPQPYLQYTLNNTLISGFSANSGGQAPTENPGTEQLRRK
jgi:hypothetical protein